MTTTERLLVLDLYSGSCSATKPMLERGWEVVTVDAHAKASVQADVRRWSWDGRAPDLIWASPPCEEFTRTALPWTRDEAPAPSLEHVGAVLRIVRECRPRFWCLENVRGAQQWIGAAPQRFGSIYLWGWYPRFRAVVQADKGRYTTPVQRAAIPYGLGLALAQAVEQAVQRSGAIAPPAAEDDSAEYAWASPQQGGFLGAASSRPRTVAGELLPRHEARAAGVDDQAAAAGAQRTRRAERSPASSRRRPEGGAK